jgi:predicted kinase
MIIVVMGLPGSGKSYFAEKLAQQLEAVYINSDKTRTALGARGKYTFEDKLNVYKSMAEKASQSLADGKRVVVDATFYQRRMIDLFRDLARQYLSPVCFIKVEADERLIKYRLSRSRADSEADYDVYLKIKEQFEPLTIPYLSLQSEDDNINHMLELALDYIGEIHE